MTAFRDVGRTERNAVGGFEGFQGGAGLAAAGDPVGKGSEMCSKGYERVPGEGGALHGSRMIWKASINRNPTYSSGRPLRKMVQKRRRIERQGSLQSVGGGFEGLQGGAEGELPDKGSMIWSAS